MADGLLFVPLRSVKNLRELTENKFLNFSGHETDDAGCGVFCDVGLLTTKGQGPSNNGFALSFRRSVRGFPMLPSPVGSLHRRNLGPDLHEVVAVVCE